jgi:hypothetical protein
MNNSQRILDILPPQKKQPEAKVFAPKKSEPPKNESSESKPSSWWKRFLILLVIAGALFFSLSQFVFNKSEVLVWPETENSTLSDKVTVNTSKASVDVVLGAIPGSVIEQEQTVSQSFTSSGKTTEGGKATGKIRVYNDYSTAQQVLVATTRFISAEGKLFRSAETVTIPGATMQGGKLQTSYADVSVIADQIGESYNIAPTTFSIPGFLGTAKYTAFYGKSLEPMTGGFLGAGSQVTKEDIENAKKALTEKALQKGRDSLEEKIPDGAYYSKDAVSSEVVESSSSVAAGAKAETFDYSVKVKIKTVTFKKSDLEEFSKDLILSKYSEQKSVKDGSLKAEWTLDSYDVPSGKMVLNINTSAVVYAYIDKEGIMKAIAGTNQEEAKKFISGQEGITKVEINSWPFWSAKLPNDENKIALNLILD